MLLLYPVILSIMYSFAIHQTLETVMTQIQPNILSALPSKINFQSDSGLYKIILSQIIPSLTYCSNLLTALHTPLSFFSPTFISLSNGTLISANSTF